MTTIEIDTVVTHKILFDKSNLNWDEDGEYNFVFLNSQINYLKTRLQHRGHLFVNEIFSAFALPITSDGQVSGWLAEQGHLEVQITPAEENSSNYWLEFDVHGVIVNEI